MSVPGVDEMGVCFFTACLDHGRSTEAGRDFDTEWYE